MPWFKVDDNFYDHPKLLDVPNAAVGLWTKAGSWCARHLTDGVIPAAKVRDFKGTTAQVSALISSGLWVESTTTSGAKAYAFCNWSEYQPTKESVEKERAEAAERKRKSRNRKARDQEQSKNVTGDVTPESHPMSQEGVTDVSHFPDPTRPDPTHKEEEKQPKKKNDYPASFEEWYEIYPRHVGKADALKAWKAATKKVNRDDLNDATRRWAQAYEASGKDPNYIPYPATWLRRGGWDDELPTAELLPATKLRTDLDAFLTEHAHSALTDQEPPF